MMLKSFLKWFFTIFFLLIFFLLYNSIYFDIPRDEIENKYAKPPSDFIILDDGSRIHYRDEGNPNGPTIFLLHGFTSSLFSFEKLTPLINQEYRIISFDFPGFGLTGAVPNRDYSFEALLKTVKKMKNKLEVENFTILGHSMGGRVAWYYAAQNPNEIDGLIIIGSGVIADNDDLRKVKENTGDPIIFDLLRTDFPFKNQLLYITPRFFASQGAKTAIFDHTLVTDELVTQYHEIALLEGSRMAFGDMMSDINDEDFLDDIDLLKSIKSPTLVIHGEKDNLVSLWSVDYFIQNIAQAQYKLYPNIGHFPVYENPLQSANDINKFLLSLK